MTDDMEIDEFDALAAEYALGLLSPAETTAFEEALISDPDLRDRYARWASDFVALTDDFEPVTPPAAILTQLKSELFASESSAAKTPFWQRLGLMPYALAGVAIAALVLVSTDLRIVTPAFAPEYQAQVAAADQSLIVLAAYDADTATLRVERTSGAARDGRALELWVIAGDNPPVSLGVMPDADKGDIIVPEPLRLAMAGGTLAISDEPLGGSTTGAPTGDVLAIGPLTLL